MNELLNYLSNYAKKRKNKHRFSAVMVCLAVIVSFTVYIGLIEPAESASGQLACGMEEHEHTQDCFELICGFDDESEEEISVDTTEIGSEETTETACETEETTTETTETTTSTEVEETAPVHVHNDECYRLICLTEAHLHKQDCYNQPVETTEPAATTETSASISTGTTTSTEQTTETTTTTTELSEEVYELNAALFGELYMDRVSVLADAQTITKDGNEYPYYEIEDVKFYYDNATLYVNNKWFSYKKDGTNVGDNAHHPACNVTSNVSVEYNGTIRKGVYNFDYPRLGDVRYISFEAPEDGTLIYVFSKIEENDATTYKIRVTRQEGEADNVNDDVVIVNDKDFSKDTSNELKITVKKGETYEIRQTAGEKTARIGCIDFIPNIKIEEYKFYYDNNKILNHHDCFSYPDGTEGPNVDSVILESNIVYNGNTYTNTYDFNKTEERYITLTAPQNGTLLMAFDGGTYDINVLKTDATDPKRYSCNNRGQNVIAVPVVAGGVYKIYQDADDADNALLAYAEFVPTFTKEEIAANLEKTYRIRNVKTGLYLEVEKANPDNNTKIKIGQYSYNDKRNDFKFVDAGSGNFNIKTLLNDSYMLDYDGTNIKTYSTNNETQQNRWFKFNINDDGTYKINTYKRNGGDVSNLYIDQTDNNYVKASETATGDDFIIVEATEMVKPEVVYPPANIDGKTYLIRNVNSRKYLHRDVYEKDDNGNIKKDADGNPIVENPNSIELVQQKDTSIYSQFKFVSTGTAGEYYIVSTDGELALTRDWTIQNGTAVKYAAKDYNENYKNPTQLFHAEQMENGSIRFYQIDNNGKKFYLEIEGEAINDGAEVDLGEADKVKDNQCFFLVPVVAPEEVPEANTRVEARVIFADYNDGKFELYKATDDKVISGEKQAGDVKTNERNLYDEPAWTPTIELYKGNESNPIYTEKGNLVVDVSEARKDWCYQYNYVWDLGESNTNDKYYVALNGVNNNQITLNGKTFNVYYLKDTELGHPGQCNKNDPYSQSPSDYNQTGDQIIYIFLDPVVEEWWPNGNQPGTFDLSMKKRWDGHNSDGFDNRKKEKIQIQLQRLNSSGQWVEYKPEAFGETYTFKCYFEVVDVNGKNKRYVDLRGFLNYKKNLNIPDATNVTNIKRTLTNNGAEYTIVYNNETYTFSEDDFNYEDLKNHNCLFEKESGTLKRANLELGYNEWNNVVLTVDGNNNPTHFTNGYYFNWKAIPYGQYRVIETMSFYDANENDVFDEGDRDTSNEYYYMSYPPMRDSRGVLHIQNFTKDMVLDIQKEWYDNTGTEKMDNPGKTVKVNIYRSLEKIDDPKKSNFKDGAIYSNVEVIDDNIILKTTDKHEKLLLKTTSEQKYYYYIQEVSVDGYKLFNGNDDNFVKSTNGKYYVDYEDGDGRKFILKNKADFSLNIEKKWYQGDVELSYSKIENPIRPEFEIYKADIAGTPVVSTANNTISYAVEYTYVTAANTKAKTQITKTEVSLELIGEAKVDESGNLKIIYNNNTTTTSVDTLLKTSKLDMSEIVEEVTPQTGFLNKKLIRDKNDNVVIDNNNYITIKEDGIFWAGTKNNDKRKGTLTIEVYEEDREKDIEIWFCDKGIHNDDIYFPKVKDYNGTIKFSNLNLGGNYRIRASAELRISKITFTLDNYYYIREKNSDSYTLLNGNDNGFVMNENGTYYTQITASNKNPTITAKNTADVEIDITKEWYADENKNKQLEGDFNKSMKFKIYKAYAQGTPKETTASSTASCYLESGSTTCSLIEYTGSIKVKNNSTTTATVSRSNGYYTTPADGKLSIIELPAYDPVTENGETIYKKVCYYIQEADGNFKLLNGNDCGFVQNGGNTYGTAFDDTSSNSGKYNFVNTPKLEITVNKMWLDADGNTDYHNNSREMKFKLYRTTNTTNDPISDYRVGEYVTENRTKLIQNLDAYDSNGKKYNYYIVEISSDGNYSVDNYIVTYSETNVSWNKDGKQPVINVTNQAKPQNYELPETGGIGTLGYTVTGGAIILLSAMILLFKRRTQL